MADIDVTIAENANIEVQINDESVPIDVSITEDITQIACEITSIGPKGDDGIGLPPIAEGDEGKVVRVIDGQWALVNFYNIAANPEGGNTLTI